MPLNAHTNTVRAAPPKTGDYTICAYCDSVLMFTSVGLRLLTGKQLEKALADPNVQRARAILAQIYREGGPKE